MPIQIPYLQDLHEEPKTRAFVELMLWFYHDNSQLAQKKWCEMVRAEYENRRDSTPNERIISELIGRLKLKLENYNSFGKRYTPPKHWYQTLPRRR